MNLSMKKDTAKKYNLLREKIAAAFGAEEKDKMFNIDIPQETKLNDKIAASLDFLSEITMAPVVDMKGQALNLGVDGLLAKRTDTSSNDRTPTAFGGLTGTKWEVALTEFDVSIPYLTLDQWARYDDFYQRYLASVYRQIGLDRLSIGFHGTSVATATNKTNNPLGQDVNKGWLKLLEENNAANYMKKSGTTANKITIGEYGDYKNADHLAYDLLAGIPMEHRTGNEVVIIGTGLAADSVMRGLAKFGLRPSEKDSGVRILEGTFGGLRAVQVPKFPEFGMMITDPKNLHLYYQEGRMRRLMKDQPERSCVSDYISSNDAYAIGNVKAIAAIHAANVEFVDVDPAPVSGS